MDLNKEDIFDKWKPILDSAGATGSKANWLSQYMEKHEILDNSISPTQSAFESSLFPISMKVASQTIGLNLVPVKPMGGNSEEELDKIQKEVISTNRDGKIDSLIEGKEYKEMKVEDHPDYGNGMPSGNLMYLDFKYGSTQSTAI
jgi:hypothetical protein